MSTVIASLNTESLIHNLKFVRQTAPKSLLSAVVKDNAYGHGIEELCGRVDDLVDGYCVATLKEGLELRQITATKPIWVLLGFNSQNDLRRMVKFNLMPVVHSEHQIDILRQVERQVSVIFEVDTGMGRLGFHDRDANDFLRRIQAVANVEVLMSHLSCADETSNPYSERQIQAFSHFADGIPIPKSIANSGGIISGDIYHLDWIRPGLLLYGVTPSEEGSSEELGLRPVMTLTSQIIAIRYMKRGDCVGYGATYVCPENMPVGIVGCGYGDGYPRSLESDAGVSLNGRFSRILGRVSMDSMAIDLRGLGTVDIGDEVILWGAGLPIEIVAKNCRTIPNELLTRVTQRVERRWI